MAEKEKPNGINRKTAIEQESLINEVIKRENRFHAINKVFTLNLKRCKFSIILEPNSNNTIRKTNKSRILYFT